MQKVVLATGNPGKVAELNALLAKLKVEALPQSAYSVPIVAETGLSFVENAIIKARNAAQHTGLPAIADDSGLEVEALAGAPGVHSARYAGLTASDRENREKLLADMATVPEPRRGARFQCVIVYLRHAADPTPLICQGTWKGAITRTPRGDSGFGYDPVFYVPGQDLTAAELEPEVKNRLSHRGQALRRLLGTLVH